MSDNDQPQAPPQEEREIREGAWHAIQQGAQVFGEIGVAAVGQERTGVAPCSSTPHSWP